jgi:raffinose/stachyose/melibiose transport system permease protein
MMNMLNKKADYKGKTLFYIVLILLSLLIILPLYVVVLNSFKNETEAAVVTLSLPKKFLFSNYWEVIIKGGIFRALLNGIFISSITVVLNIIMCSMGAFTIARRNTKVNKFFYNFIILGLVAPLGIIPELKIMQALHINGSYLAMIILYITVNIPFSLFLYTGFIKGVPKELDESGIVEGCGPIKLFMQLIFPLLKPVVFTNLIMVFMNVWNDFGLALYFLPKRSMYTMPMTTYSFTGLHTSSMQLICADLVLTALPVVIVYLFAQKYIITGMTAGAVKG